MLADWRLQRHRQGGYAQRGGFQRGADRAADGYARSDVFAVVNPGDNQVRFETEHLVIAMQESLGWRAAHSVYLPFLAIDRQRARFDNAVGFTREGTSHRGLLDARRDDMHKTQRGERFGSRPQTRRVDAVIVGQ